MRREYRLVGGAREGRKIAMVAGVQVDSRDCLGMGGMGYDVGY